MKTCMQCGAEKKVLKVLVCEVDEVEYVMVCSGCGIETIESDID